MRTAVALLAFVSCALAAAIPRDTIVADVSHIVGGTSVDLGSFAVGGVDVDGKPLIHSRDVTAVAGAVPKVEAHVPGPDGGPAIADINEEVQAKVRLDLEKVVNDGLEGVTLGVVEHGKTSVLNQELHVARGEHDDEGSWQDRVKVKLMDGQLDAEVGSIKLTIPHSDA
jgi:hypothetical protein